MSVDPDMLNESGHQVSSQIDIHILVAQLWAVIISETAHLTYRVISPHGGAARHSVRGRRQVLRRQGYHQCVAAEDRAGQ